MIRPLRQRHRHIVLVLGVFIPVVFVVGIVMRNPVPGPISLPAGLGVVPQPLMRVEWKRVDLFAKSPVKVCLLRNPADTRRLSVEFSAAKDFIKPDLIVYWVAGDSPINNALPGDAVLLGSFSSAVLPLPVEAVNSNGVFVLYSLADNEIVDVSKPVRFNNPVK